MLTSGWILARGDLRVADRCGAVWAQGKQEGGVPSRICLGGGGAGGYRAHADGTGCGGHPAQDWFVGRGDAQRGQNPHPGTRAGPLRAGCRKVGLSPVPPPSPHIHACAHTLSSLFSTVLRCLCSTHRQREGTGEEREIEGRRERRGETVTKEQFAAYGKLDGEPYPGLPVCRV